MTRIKQNGDPYTKGSKVYVIHWGYARILAGLKADVKQMEIESNESGNILFCGTYAQNILNQFAIELKDTDSPSCDHGPNWRSYILNPLLQRQLRGYSDHEAPMLAMEFKGLEGEALRIAIDTFYLSRDPLAPAEQASLRRGILYVTEYRWFLGSNAVMRKDIAHYEVCWATTNNLYARLAQSNPQEDRLQQFKLTVISSEYLEQYYKADAEAAVRGTDPS